MNDRVKLFAVSSLGSAEKEINNWLAGQDGIAVRAIVFHGATSFVFACVHYLDGREPERVP